MDRTGHVGVALLCYAPVAAGLDAAGYGSLVVFGGLVAVGLATVPDCDLVIPGLRHRGVTHTVWFVLAGGVVVGAAGFVVASPPSGHSGLVFGGVIGGVGGLTLASHVLADALTPMGVRPFWPLGTRTYTLSLVRSDDRFWNAALLTLGGLATGAVALALVR